MISIIFTNLQDGKICQVSYRWWQSAHYRIISQNQANNSTQSVGAVWDGNLHAKYSFPNTIEARIDVLTGPAMQVCSDVGSALVPIS
jgi:hypothetical protein